MRKFIIQIDDGTNNNNDEYFELPNDATEEEIMEEAKYLFNSYCSFTVREITGEEE